jgi:hypothetical protein
MTNIQALSNRDLVRLRQQVDKEIKDREASESRDNATQLIADIIAETGCNIREKTRKQPLITYRHLAMEALYFNHGLSKNRIAKMFYSDHASVIYVIRTVGERRITGDPLLADCEKDILHVIERNKQTSLTPVNKEHLQEA